jgi:hypothetical protein
LTPEQVAILGAAFEQVASGLRRPKPAECAEHLGYERDE